MKQRPYRIPVHLNAVVNNQVNDMLERGIIRASNSPWSSPIVLAPKKDGDYRFCVDFRRVNSVTKKDAHPMPRIDEILDQLGGARYFSTLDLASGYWQVPLREEDMEKTAFSVGADHYELTVMPFGLTNAPATFQRMMGNLLKGIKGCLVFIDDIIYYFFGHVGATSAYFGRSISSRSGGRVEDQTRQMSICSRVGKIPWSHCVSARNGTGLIES